MGQINQRMIDGTIYFLVTTEIEPPRVKIGFTKYDVSRRFKAIQSTSPVKLRIAAHYPGTLAGEMSVHETFAHLRLHNEWFVLGDDLAYLIEIVGDGDVLAPAEISA